MLYASNHSFFYQFLKCLLHNVRDILDQQYLNTPMLLYFWIVSFITSKDDVIRKWWLIYRIEHFINIVLFTMQDIKIKQELFWCWYITVNMLDQYVQGLNNKFFEAFRVSTMDKYINEKFLHRGTLLTTLHFDSPKGLFCMDEWFIIIIQDSRAQ